MMLCSNGQCFGNCYWCVLDCRTEFCISHIVIFIIVPSLLRNCFDPYMRRLGLLYFV